jgi:hypothetical protein
MPRPLPVQPSGILWAEAGIDQRANNSRIKLALPKIVTLSLLIFIVGCLVIAKAYLLYSCFISFAMTRLYWYGSRLTRSEYKNPPASIAGGEDRIIYASGLKRKNRGLGAEEENGGVLT